MKQLTLTLFASIICLADPAIGEVYRVNITPELKLEIGGNSITCGVLVGHGEDIVELARAGILSHCSCEALLVDRNSSDFADSVLRPMSPAPTYNVDPGTVILEVPSIGIDLKMHYVGASLQSTRVKVEYGSTPSCTVPVAENLKTSCRLEVDKGEYLSGDSNYYSPAVNMAGEKCILEEICMSTENDLSAVARCGAVAIGMSTNGDSILGVGPVSITISAP